MNMKRNYSSPVSEILSLQSLDVVLGSLANPSIAGEPGKAPRRNIGVMSDGLL